jgi:hypothetical protein
MKKCVECNTPKELSEFNRSQCHGQEKLNYCKDCGKKKRKLRDMKIKEGTIQAY